MYMAGMQASATLTNQQVPKAPVQTMLCCLTQLAPALSGSITSRQLQQQRPFLHLPSHVCKAIATHLALRCQTRQDTHGPCLWSSTDYTHHSLTVRFVEAFTAPCPSFCPLGINVLAHLVAQQARDVALAARSVRVQLSHQLFTQLQCLHHQWLRLQQAAQQHNSCYASLCLITSHRRASTSALGPCVSRFSATVSALAF